MNVLLITADQMRGDALACNGNPFVETPNLDRLAEGGITFTRAYTPNSICVPARASITTGNYSHRATGIKDNWGRIRDGQDKIAEVFNHSGYETYAVGKLHYVPYSPPGKPRLLHGFKHAELTEEGRILKEFDSEGELSGLEDYYDYLKDVGWSGYTRAHGIGNNDLHPAPSPVPAEHTVDSWVGSRTMAHLTRHLETKKNTPFFMWMSFPKPHSPYDPPSPYNTLYDPRKISPPIGHGDLQVGRDPYLRLLAERHGIRFLSPETLQVMRAHYYGLVTFQDQIVGKVLDFLDEAGLADDTIVIYASDHGDLLGDFGSCFKSNFQEGAVHIPFIWRVPGMTPSGMSSKALVGLQDILPTLAHITGAELAYPTDGINLVPLFKGEDRVRDIYISQTRDTPLQSYMAFDGRWKYIYSEANGVEELYDLQNEPQELRNLFSEGESLNEAARLKKQIAKWCAEKGDNAMLDGNNLKRTEVDIDALACFRPGAMGWRWY